MSKGEKKVCRYLQRLIHEKVVQNSAQPKTRDILTKKEVGKKYGENHPKRLLQESSNLSPNDNLTTARTAKEVGLKLKPHYQKRAEEHSRVGKKLDHPYNYAGGDTRDILAEKEVGKKYGRGQENRLVHESTNLSRA